MKCGHGRCRVHRDSGVVRVGRTRLSVLGIDICGTGFRLQGTAPGRVSSPRRTRSERSSTAGSTARLVPSVDGRWTNLGSTNWTTTVGEKPDIGIYFHRVLVCVPPAPQYLTRTARRQKARAEISPQVARRNTANLRENSGRSLIKHRIY